MLSPLLFYRFSEAWKTCQVLNRKETWEQLAEVLMRNLEIEFGEDQIKLVEPFSIMNLSPLRGLQSWMLGFPAGTHG
jgi:hypothetical protein